MLEKDLEHIKVTLQFAQEEREELQNQLRHTINENEEMSSKYNLLVTDLRQTGQEVEAMKKERNQSLEFCAKFLSGDSLDGVQEMMIKDMITRYLPNMLKNTTEHEKGFLPPIVKSPSHTSITSQSKLPARMFRRQTRKPR